MLDTIREMSLLHRFSNKLLNPRFILTARLSTAHNPNTFPDVPTCSYYDDQVKTAGLDEDLETVGYLLNKRVRDGCFNTSRTFSFITNTTSSLSILDDLCNALARLDDGFPRKSAYDTLIARLCKIGRVEESLRVVDIMARGGYGLSACSFHPILSLLTRGKKMDEAWRLVEKMTELEVSPDLTAYNYLLTAYCYKGDLISAREVIKKMEELKMGADARMYDALVLGACRSGKVEGAFVILRRMIDEGQTVLYATYSHIMMALLDLGYYTQAVKFVMACGNRDVKLDTEVYGTLASKLIKLKRIDEAKFLVGEMEKRGLQMGYKLRGFYTLHVSKYNIAPDSDDESDAVLG